MLLKSATKQSLIVFITIENITLHREKISTKQNYTFNFKCLTNIKNTSSSKTSSSLPPF